MKTFEEFINEAPAIEPHKSTVLAHNPRELLNSKTHDQLKGIIKRAVKDHALPTGNGVPKKGPYDGDAAHKQVLINHINGICNEYGVTPNEHGYLIVHN